MKGVWSPWLKIRELDFKVRQSVIDCKIGWCPKFASRGAPCSSCLPWWNRFWALLSPRRHGEHSEKDFAFLHFAADPYRRGLCLFIISVMTEQHRFKIFSGPLKSVLSSGEIDTAFHLSQRSEILFLSLITLVSESAPGDFVTLGHRFQTRR